MYSVLAGLDCAEPGFKSARIAPQIGDRFAHASFEYKSIAGTWKVAWRRNEQTIEYSITVPANCTAHCALPIEGEQSIREGDTVLGDINTVSGIKVENKRAIFDLSSGSYTFIAGDTIL